MARKKEDPKAEKAAPSTPGKKSGSPSVTAFLSKISTPKGARDDGDGKRHSSPAKDLLGGITRDDIANVGRVELAEAPSAATQRGRTQRGDDGVALEETEEFQIEMMAEADPPGRKLERIGWQGVVDVRGVFAGPITGADGMTRASNVSQGGVFVETAHLLEVGDPVVLSFPGDPSDPGGSGGAGNRLVVSGRVRWVSPFGRVDDPTPGMGIEFVGLDKAKRDKIERMLGKARSN